jgi:hypothetical protein
MLLPHKTTNNMITRLFKKTDTFQKDVCSPQSDDFDCDVGCPDRGTRLQLQELRVQEQMAVSR